MSKMQTVRELYRVDAKYWKTGDVDILPLRSSLSDSLDKRFGYELINIMSVVTRKHYPVQRFVDVCKLLGIELEEDDDEAD